MKTDDQCPSDSPPANGSATDMPTECPYCSRELSDGDGCYECHVCSQECCTMCSDTTTKHDVVCDECLEVRGYDDGWTQGRGYSQSDQADR